MTKSKAASFSVRMSLQGHEDSFRPRLLSGCCGFSQETFAGAHGSDGNAPVRPFGCTSVNGSERPTLSSRSSRLRTSASRHPKRSIAVRAVDKDTNDAFSRLARPARSRSALAEVGAARVHKPWGKGALILPDWSGRLPRREQPSDAPTQLDPADVSEALVVVRCSAVRLDQGWVASFDSQNDHPSKRGRGTDHRDGSQALARHIGCRVPGVLRRTDVP
jgi:hypothetical protein